MFFFIVVLLVIYIAVSATFKVFFGEKIGKTLSVALITIVSVMLLTLFFWGLWALLHSSGANPTSYVYVGVVIVAAILDSMVKITDKILNITHWIAFGEN